MKNLLLIALFSFFIANSYAQEVTTIENAKPVNANQLILKARKLNTAGWIFLGTGTALAIAAYSVYPRNYNLFVDSKSKDNRAFTTVVLTVLSGAAIITSIPMFATSAMKKLRARLMIKNENVSLNIPVKSDKNITALSINISLGNFK